MKFRIIFSFFITAVALAFYSKDLPAQNIRSGKPKLVVGIVVDQMRWDFLYRYQERYGKGGLNRMLSQGFTAENMQIPYAQTVTAAGHSSIYTGSVPALTGIIGNEWYDAATQSTIYCVDDKLVKMVGGSQKTDPMSPKNNLAGTITDELRLATNFRSKVVGVAIKDRGSILPAGHFGDAFWYDNFSGDFVTSDYYMPELPKWVQHFNQRKLADSFYSKNWNTLLPIDTYKQSTSDNNNFEVITKGANAPIFPHLLEKYVGKDYGAIRNTPYGNNFTLEFAKAAIQGESLGKDAFTDFLAISLSSTDYVGHQFGPNSIEIEDTYLRLDQELAKFFEYLDTKIGAGQYVVFLTADHGVAHIPTFLSENGYKVEAINEITTLKNKLEETFKVPELIAEIQNNQVYINKKLVEEKKLDVDLVEQEIIKLLEQSSVVQLAFSYQEFDDVILPHSLKEKFVQGFFKHRSGDIQIVLKPGCFFGSNKGTTHGNWNPYDAHIPFVLMGWNIKHGASSVPTYMTDIAPTIANLLKIQMPNACIGNAITECILR